MKLDKVTQLRFLGVKNTRKDLGILYFGSVMN